MGLSSSTTELLFFIGAVIIATTVVTVLASGIQSISTGVKERSNSISENLKGDIAIVNDPTEVANNPVIIYVKNTGVANMNETHTTIVLDGEIIISPTFTYMETSGFVDDSVWGPGEVIKVEIDSDLAAGLHTVKVTMNGDVTDRMDFEM